MSQRKLQTRAQQQRTTTFVALATFTALSVIALVVWSLTRAAEPAPVASALPVAEAAVMPMQASASETFERIEPNEAKELVASGKAIMLDVRSIEQYKATHVADALHIPVPLVQGEIPYLPKDKLIITYCTCPAEESSGEATMILARGGLQSKALLGGLNAWVNAGYGTAVGL
jgi:rhodanese-related sulfurtransferase